MSNPRLKPRFTKVNAIVGIILVTAFFLAFAFCKQ
jgi:hypothetical protein